MPFELRHVNVYLLRDGDAYTLIDTGLQTEESRQVLNQQLAGLKVPMKRINRILITHIHPDHFGLAGELRERSGAELIIHRLEVALMEPRYARAEDLVHDVGKWLSKNGAPEEEAEYVKSASMGAREYVSGVEPDAVLDGAGQLAAELFQGIMQRNVFQQRLALQETLAHCQSLAVEGRLHKQVSRELVTWMAA